MEKAPAALPGLVATFSGIGTIRECTDVQRDECKCWTAQGRFEDTSEIHIDYNAIKKARDAGDLQAVHYEVDIASEEVLTIVDVGHTRARFIPPPAEQKITISSGMDDLSRLPVSKQQIADFEAIARYIMSNARVAIGDRSEGASIPHVPYKMVGDRIEASTCIAITPPLNRCVVSTDILDDIARCCPGRIENAYLSLVKSDADTYHFTARAVVRRIDGGDRPKRRWIADLPEPERKDYKGGSERRRAAYAKGRQ